MSMKNSTKIKKVLSEACGEFVFKINDKILISSLKKSIKKKLKDSDIDFEEVVIEKNKDNILSGQVLLHNVSKKTPNSVRIIDFKVTPYLDPE